MNVLSSFPHSLSFLKGRGQGQGAPPPEPAAANIVSLSDLFSKVEKKHYFLIFYPTNAYPNLVIAVIGQIVIEKVMTDDE